MKNVVSFFCVCASVLMLTGCCHTGGKPAETVPETTACGCPEGCGCEATTANTCTCNVHNNS